MIFTFSPCGRRMVHECENDVVFSPAGVLHTKNFAFVLVLEFLFPLLLFFCHTTSVSHCARVFIFSLLNFRYTEFFPHFLQFHQNTHILQTLSHYAIVYICDHLRLKMWKSIHMCTTAWQYYGPVFRSRCSAFVLGVKSGSIYRMKGNE